ncbi:hypothetical protein Halhy_2096 [Haliscomenobacter hydrossis DSM 1100]|uniref:Uncharacterized protein n=1 Tax=Haliscomenobacter hydrossis (strain ATCC 27775 / DSM 1100 / LMG 10767 / O) TaxID=760192 RepID=F4KQJ2_HALH1|nr:hypothetical protein Halhy_2096 [Haliscomenobacter hydrossis DSM 1100]
MVLFSFEFEKVAIIDHDYLQKAFTKKRSIIVFIFMITLLFRASYPTFPSIRHHFPLVRVFPSSGNADTYIFSNLYYYMHVFNVRNKNATSY